MSNVPAELKYSKEQDVVVSLFFEQFSGVNKLNFGIRFMFRQHQNIYGNGGAKELRKPRVRIRKRSP